MLAVRCRDGLTVSYFTFLRFVAHLLRVLARVRWKRLLVFRCHCHWCCNYHLITAVIKLLLIWIIFDSMYRDLVAAKQSFKHKAKSKPQSDPLGPARSGVHRQRAVRPNSNVSNHISSWSNRSQGRTQSSEQMLSPERYRQEISAATSSRAAGASGYELAIGIDPVHTESGPMSAIDSRRPLLRRISSRHMSRPRDLSSTSSIGSLSEMPETRYYQLLASDMIARNAPDMIPLLAVDSESTPMHNIPTAPTTSFSTLSRLSTATLPHTTSIVSSTPDLSSLYRLDELDESSDRPAILRQRNTAHRVVSYDQLRSQTYRRARHLLNDPGSNRDLSRQGLDGLGDRRRSFTPEDESWETLLTTITPDERLPSVHSSFTSTDIGSSSVPSGSTAISLPMVEMSGVSHLLCDNDGSEESGTESERHIMTTVNRRYLPWTNFEQSPH